MAFQLLDYRGPPLAPLWLSPLLPRVGDPLSRLPPSRARASPVPVAPPLSKPRQDSRAEPQGASDTKASVWACGRWAATAPGPPQSHELEELQGKGVGLGAGSLFREGDGEFGVHVGQARLGSQDVGPGCPQQCLPLDPSLAAPHACPPHSTMHATPSTVLSALYGVLFL